VSESILDHGYIPEEHAPDPVISHGDPTPPGKVGIWMFLASEIMFFVAILGSYIVIRAGAPDLFAANALTLSKAWAGLNTVVLIFSSLTMALAVDAAQKGQRKFVVRNLLLTFLCAAAFLGVKAIEYTDKIHHQTIVARDSSAVYVYDGHTRQAKDGAITLTGYRMPMPRPEPGRTEFDIHLVSEEQVKSLSGTTKEQTFIIRPADLNTAITYGPWKNLFFAAYFTLTGLHALHVFGGMIALGILLSQSLRGKLFPAHTEYVGLYWHFVDLVWIFLFPLLYLI